MKTMTNSITPDDIVILDRQRKEFPDEEAQRLRQSILDHGLFHAPGLVSASTPTLVYGHRRTLALRSIIADGLSFTYNKKTYDSTIPFVAVGDLTDLQLQEIELSENLDRLDLSWQDKARTLADLEALRNAQRGEVAAILDAEPVPITIKELAAETKKSTAKVSEDLAIAKHLSDPDVAAAKTAKEAQKIVKRKAKEQLAADAAQAFNPAASTHSLIHADCREGIKTLPSKTFTAIVTDPPYGIEMHKDQSWDGTWHEYDDTEAYCFNLISALLPEWDRVTLPQAHMYIFCDWSKFEQIKNIIDAYTDADGNPVFATMPYPFIWFKGNVASYPRPDHWPRKSYECILYCIKGDKPHNRLDAAVLQTPQKQNHDHPAGKPSDLYATLIDRSCLPGDRVLDCFAGQGTIFKAAKKTSTIATGIELSDKYINLAKQTLSGLGE